MIANDRCDIIIGQLMQRLPAQFHIVVRGGRCGDEPAILDLQGITGDERLALLQIQADMTQGVTRRMDDLDSACVWKLFTVKERLIHRRMAGFKSGPELLVPRFHLLGQRREIGFQLGKLERLLLPIDV